VDRKIQNTVANYKNVPKHSYCDFTLCSVLCLIRRFVAKPVSIFRVTALVYVHAEIMEWKIEDGRIYGRKISSTFFSPPHDFSTSLKQLNNHKEGSRFF
jgi:hypothetical protein